MDLTVVVRDNDVELRRNARSTLDRSTSIYLELSEVDALVAKLSNVREVMARERRVKAQRLLTEAEQLDPSV